MVNLARTGFASNQSSRRKELHNDHVKQSESTTASALVSLQTPGKQELIRVVMDSGSQSSYISEKIITQLKASPLRTETVIHALFGGKETKPTYHEVFPVEVSNLNRAFSCSFEVLSEKTICGFIPRIENKQILNELKRKKIDFTDSFRNETEINLLIGADVLGKLLTGNTVELESGLTAVETKLGWTVFGKSSYEKDNILTTLSMHSMNVPINKLWQLEVLGISSPTETEKGDLDLNDFNDKMKILPDGRYEVELPWKYDSKNLSSNKELVWKRHERMINRFGKG
ncbi:hypothetical protein AVEN_71179-1 [Araneus ventricosus]|uniref:Uncharacterized protein n=1 Tax=Araneus ventricosus TaxID=182803 RepID=A0A4Y2IYF9_ARAVE|nr:hypothetical protein AVEN_71179-1 [Araneus ventricosus]